MPARIAAADLGRLLDHRPDARDEVEIAGPSIVALQAPGDHRRLVDRRSLPFGHAVDRVLLEPVEERLVADPNLVQPLENPPADLRVAQPLQGAADPERVARPAIRAQAAVEPRGHRPVLGVGVQGRGQGRSPQADRVRGAREMQVGHRLDESSHSMRRVLLDLVQIGLGRAEPGQRRPQPVLERAPVAAPARERAADQQVDGDRRCPRAARSSGRGSPRWARSARNRRRRGGRAPGRTRWSSRGPACGWNGRGPG